MITKFDPKELKVIGETPPLPLMPSIKIYDYPVSPKDAMMAMYARKPYWQIIGVEKVLFNPSILPDNVARGFVIEGRPFNAAEDGGGKCMFGVDWEYEPFSGGSMVRPGNPLLSDANAWREKLVWPNLDDWDWEGSAKLNTETILKTDKFVQTWLFSGWFERLISFMDFEGAIMAMYDEDQKAAVSELFARLTDLYIEIFERMIKHFPMIDGFCIHDDWGSQKETFFSPALVEEMIVPHMKRITTFLRSKGKFTELHSCGQILKQVPNIIAAGWDQWTPQVMSIAQEAYETYGNQLLIGTVPDFFDPLTTPEEEQRVIARAYVDKFCSPSKPSYYGIYAGKMLTPAVREEIYVRSRERYSK
ncbi:MAG: methyltransferase [Oscillospiraceae bacterium]|nr:methyltransferase [Oscillospiraceae bacterium]